MRSVKTALPSARVRAVAGARPATTSWMSLPGADVPFSVSRARSLAFGRRAVWASVRRTGRRIVAVAEAPSAVVARHTYAPATRGVDQYFDAMTISVVCAGSGQIVIARAD